jgi:hypothetical protein
MIGDMSAAAERSPQCRTRIRDAAGRGSRWSRFRATSDGYVEIERSEALPEIDPAQLASFLGVQSASAAIRASRAALAETRRSSGPPA